MMKQLIMRKTNLDEESYQKAVNQSFTRWERFLQVLTAIGISIFFPFIVSMLLALVMPIGISFLIGDAMTVCLLVSYLYIYLSKPFTEGKEEKRTVN